MKCHTCRKDNAVLTWWERVRFWLFEGFHQDILDLSQEKYTMGFGDGYKKAYEFKTHESTIVLEGIQKLDEKLERALRPLMPESKYEGLDINQVMDIIMAGGKPVITLAGEPLTPTEQEQLKSEADYLSRSNLWRIMQETVKAKAIEKSVVQSKNWEEVLGGKMMLHNLGLLHAMVDRILKMK